jgi:hypothetical protein
MKQKIIKSFKYIAIGIFFALAISYVQAWGIPLTNTFTDNLASPQVNNVEELLNVIGDQEKQGGLSLGGWLAAGQDSQVTGQTTIGGILRGGKPGDTSSNLIFGGDVKINGEMSSNGNISSDKIKTGKEVSLCADEEGNIVICALASNSGHLCILGTRKDNNGNCAIPSFVFDGNVPSCTNTKDEHIEMPMPFGCAGYEMKKRIQTFVVGDSVAAGDIFYVSVYSHPIFVTATSSDTPLSITTRLKNSISSTSAASWNVLGSVVGINTPGFPPTARVVFQSSGGGFVDNIPRLEITQDFSHIFSAGVIPAAN